MADWTRRELSGTLTPLLLGACSAADGRPKTVLPRSEFTPGYARLERAGLLAPRIDALHEIYKDCRLCPRACGINRTRGGKGVCQLPNRARVASAHPHFGEERPLVGRGGSGTIFFSRCNLLCEFCQNWEINHRGDGSWMSDDELATQMLALQRQGCENINLVTPTHLAPNIISAVRRAHARGLRLPLVWNCGGYESLEAIRLLDGIVDIYLPDFKWMAPEPARLYSAGAADYPVRAAEAIREMHRQTGNLVVDERGVALRGLLIRHLVMPANLARTDLFVQWVARELGPDTVVNVMGQYRPAHRASQHPALARRLTSSEYREALGWASAAGLTEIRGG